MSLVGQHALFIYFLLRAAYPVHVDSFGKWLWASKRAVIMFKRLLGTSPPNRKSIIKVYNCRALGEQRKAVLNWNDLI